jgi:hypothetical protein
VIQAVVERRWGGYRRPVGDRSLGTHLDAPAFRAGRRADGRSSSPVSYLKEIPSLTRNEVTPPFSMVRSWRTTSAMRRSRTVFAAVSTALRAAASQDSVLTPITYVTR